GGEGGAGEGAPTAFAVGAGRAVVAGGTYAAVDAGGNGAGVAGGGAAAAAVTVMAVAGALAITAIAAPGAATVGTTFTATVSVANTGGQTVTVSQSALVVTTPGVLAAGTSLTRRVLAPGAAAQLTYTVSAGGAGRTAIASA